MKVRVRVSKGRPAISLCTDEAASLGSLKEELSSSKLITGDFVLSLNGNDRLDESQTLHELGIVSGDLLHVVVARGERGGQPCCVRCGDVTGLKTANQLCHVTNQTEVANASPECSHVTDSSREYSSNGLHTSGTATVECKQNTALSMETLNMECVHSSDIECLQNTPLNAHMECGQNTPDMECGQDSQPPFHSKGQAAIKTPDVAFSSGGYFEEFLSGQLPPSGLRGGGALSLALHALMLDSGFMEQRGHTPCTTAMGVLKRFYSSAVSERVSVSMVTTVMGPTLAVHVSATILEEDGGTGAKTVSCSSQLVLNHYTSSTGGSTHLSQVLKHTRQLSRIFKDTVAHKLLAEIRKALGLPEVGTLNSLFPELKLHIMRYLDVHSLISMATTCRELYILGQDSFIWRDLFLRNFGKASAYKGEGQPWKELYIQHYKRKQESKRQHRRWVAMAMTDPLSRPPNLVPPPGFGGFPGVIGGDYDYLPHPLVPPSHMDPFTHPSLPRPRFNPYSPLPDHQLRPPNPYPPPPWSSTPPFTDGRNSRGRRGVGDVRLGQRRGGVFGGMRIF